MALEKKYAQGTAVKLADVLYVTMKNWVWALLSIVLCVGIGIIYILITPPLYNRTASIIIKDESKGRSVSSEIDAFSEIGLIKTQSNIVDEINKLQSPDIIYGAVKHLHLDFEYYVIGRFRDKLIYGSQVPIQIDFPDLDDNASLSLKIDVMSDSTYTLDDVICNDKTIYKSNYSQIKFGKTLKTSLGKLTINKSPYFNSSKFEHLIINKIPLSQATTSFQRELSVSLKNEKGNTIVISANDQSGLRAEDLILEVINIYNDKWIENRNQISVSTSNFINERLGVIEKELGSVDQDISSYQSEHLIPDVQQSASMYMEENQSTSAQLFELNNKLQMVRYMRSHINEGTNDNRVLPANTGIGNPNIESQINEYNSTLLKRNQYAFNSSETHPVVIDLDISLASMRKAIINAIDNEITTLNGQIKALQANKSKAIAQIAANPDQAKYLLSVERQQKVKETLYLYLLQKREENELTQAFTAYNTQVITYPSGSNSAITPKKGKVLVFSFFIGLMLPFGFHYVREINNTRVRGRKDLEKLTIPFIGEIPLHKSKSHKKHGKTNEYQVVVKEKSRNVINEAFRVVRTNLEFMLEEESGNKVIMVSSVNPGSGKTFVAINLAASFAIQEKRTVVIDLDMRKASLSNYVSECKDGVSAYLSNHVSDWRELVVKDIERPNLDIIPVGSIPPNPSELLLKPRLAQLIKELRECYDIVIIDCPPVEIVTDATIIAKSVDMTVFIIRAGLLERDMLPVIESYYTDKKIRNMSLLLNGTEAYEGRYGYHRYGYHYGYGYGYGYGGYTKDE